MDQKSILKFLRQVMAHNNREWFQEHKKEYEAVRAEFERGVEQALQRIVTFDPEIAHVQVKDCTYRFYRDTRFSADKSPYKNHFGAYINAKSKKALRGGYYIHLEPDHCLLAIGNYWLPTNILTSCRNEMMTNTEEWLRCVESEEFLRYFGSYCCWHAVGETFFEGDGCLDEMERMFRAGKPMMDFMNAVIDDYE